MIRPDGNEVKERLNRISRVDAGEWTPTPGQRGACIGMMNNYFGDDDLRKLVLGWLFAEPFRPLSSKELTTGQWFAIYNWIGYAKSDDGEPLVSDLFTKEFAPVMSRAITAFMELDRDRQAPFGLSVFDMALTAVASLGGEITHSFHPDQEVVYDFSEIRAEMKAQSDKAKERERQIMRELGYDDEPPTDVLGKF